MYESGTVLEVLRDARELVRDDWGSSNPDVPWAEAKGRHCASVSIIEAADSHYGVSGMSAPAHIAFLSGTDIAVPDDEDRMFATVYQFNDEQMSRVPVLAAFDAAIARLEADQATPNADAMLEIMAACDKAGAVIARRIVSEAPALDEREIAKVAACELFYAAQDTAQVAAASSVPA